MKRREKKNKIMGSMIRREKRTGGLVLVGMTKKIEKKEKEEKQKSDKEKGRELRSRRRR